MRSAKLFTVLLILAMVFILAGCGGSKIQRFETTPAALLELTNGGVDAVVADSPVVLEFIKNNAESKLKAFGDEAFEKEFYGIAMRLDETDLHKLVNDGLAKIKANGVYDKIFRKYFGDGTDYVVPKSDNRLNKTYRVASDMAYAPFESVNAAGEPEGFDMDLIRAIATEMGFEVKLVNTAWDGIIPSLTGRDSDLIISAMTITEERKQSVTFSNPYFEATQYIVVKEGSSITKLDDLKGQKVGVQNGTTGDIAVTKFLK